jgi:hypothetical protein
MPVRLIVNTAQDLTVIRVDGRLAGDGVGELERTCSTARRPLVLDLAYLTTADDTGIVALRRLAVQGAHLVGASPYVTLLLGERSAEGKPVVSRARPRPGTRRRRTGGRRK